jgi:hypothetical protein
MSTHALSSHSTQILRAPAATPSTYAVIAEVGDITPPGLERNEFDATAQQEDIDSYALGVLRRITLVFEMNFIPSDASQNHISGLHRSMIDGDMDNWEVAFPDGTAWIGAGQISRLESKAPNDGKLSLDVTIRFSGGFAITTIHAFDASAFDSKAFQT